MTTEQQHKEEGLTVREESGMAVVVDNAAIAVINRSEVDAQLSAAHKYPRTISKFMAEALTLATLSREVAESCIYALPRGGKTISGPSVRLAEICASAYGNLHVAARILEADEKEIGAQGVAWDLEKNLRVTVEARRRITNKWGKRYDDDMITVTGAAAGSIALRNAIFRVVPRAYVDTIYAKVKEVAVGTASTLASRRQEVVVRLQKMGVPIERIFPRVGKTKLEDIGLDELEILIGLGTSIKQKESTIDVAFPVPDDTAAKSAALQQALQAPPPGQVVSTATGQPVASVVQPTQDTPAAKPAVDAKAPTEPAPAPAQAPAKAKEPPKDKKHARDGSDGSVAPEDEPPPSNKGG